MFSNLFGGSSWRYYRKAKFRLAIMEPNRSIQYSRALLGLAFICGCDNIEKKGTLECNHSKIPSDDNAASIREELGQIYQQREDLIKKKRSIDIKLSELRQYQRQLEAALRNSRYSRKSSQEGSDETVEEVVQIGSTSYRITRRIGVGSFGVVVVGVNSENPMEKVAIKQCRIGDEASVADLKHELVVLSRIHELGGHNHIVRLIGTSEENELLLAMEFMPGGELFERVVKCGTLSEKDAANVVRQLAEGLDFLHSNGIVHCDIKPENILLCGDEKKGGIYVKIVDFGSASTKDLHPGQFCDSRTTAYCPPEILLGGSFTPGADMWAIGCILYIMLSGKHPFDLSGRSTKGQIEANVLTKPVTFGEKEWNNISETAKDVILKLMSVDMKERLTAKELLNHPFLQNNKHS